MHLGGDVLEEVGYLSVELLEEIKAGDTDMGVIGFQLKAWRLDGITLGEGKNGSALRGGGVEEKLLKAAEKEGLRKKRKVGGVLWMPGGEGGVAC